MTTTDTVSEEDLCRVCRQDRKWHELHKPRHQFTSMNESMDSTFGKKDDRKPPTLPRRDGPNVVPLRDGPVEVRRGLPPDHGLRLALLRAGVITLDQLSAADKEIRDAQQSGAGVVFVSPSADPEELARRLARQHHPSNPRTGEADPVRVGDGDAAQGSLWSDS